MAASEQRQSTADRVRETLRRQILSGELAPGARLREMEIARSLATSQAPVREALKELEARELIVTEAYRGTYVREITQRDMVEAYHVRAALEELAGEQASLTLRGSTDALRAAAMEAESFAARSDAQGYAHIDFGFHRAIVEAAGNRLLLRSWDALAFETRIEMLLRRSRLDLSQSVAEHHEIVRALEEGRGKDAGALLRNHSLHFAAMIAPIAPTSPDQDSK